MEKCTNQADPAIPSLPRPGDTDEDVDATNEGEDEEASVGSSDEEEELEEGMWALKRVFTVKELKKKKPIMCQTGDEGDCCLVACSEWRSRDETGALVSWNSCLDCQEA